jgi:hypothetical protein
MRMAFDEKRAVVVVFGGASANGALGTRNA